MTERLVHVVDDDDAARDALVFLLTAAHFEVKAYESPIDLLHAISAVPDGCVVTDVRMPEMNGLDLMRRLKSRQARLPIIIVTGHADISTAIEAIREGAFEFIEKPYDSDVMIETVKSALAGDAEDTRKGQALIVQERLESLSPTEHQILDALVEGHTHSTIAINLQIDTRLIDIHRAGIMTKMQASSLSHLIRMRLLAR
jgi:two-component system, LuxR family, response regulator FixJ